MTLSRLLAPCPPEDFFARYWEKRPFHVQRNEPDYFAELRSRLSLEEMIWQRSHWGEVNLVPPGGDGSYSAYADKAPDVQTAQRAYQEKYTVVVNDVQRKNADVGRFCRGIESELFCKANVNAYLTARSCLGLDRHYDEEDVFVLQLSGHKIWSVTPSPVELPAPGVPYQCPKGEGASNGATEATEFHLAPGDVLYLPRGFIHATRTEEEVSLHLTLTVGLIRWSTILTEMVQSALRRDSAFRVAVPLPMLRGQRLSEHGDTIAELLRRLGSSVHVSDALARARAQLFEGYGRLPNFPLVERPARPTSRSIVRLAPDQVYTCDSTDTGSVLRVIGYSLELPAEHLRAFQAVARSECSVERLSAVAELPMDEALFFVERLVDCGVFEIVG